MMVIFNSKIAGICQPMDYGLGGGYGGRLNNGAYGLYDAASKCRLKIMPFLNICFSMC